MTAVTGPAWGIAGTIWPAKRVSKPLDPDTEQVYFPAVSPAPLTSASPDPPGSFSGVAAVGR